MRRLLKDRNMQVLLRDIGYRKKLQERCFIIAPHQHMRRMRLFLVGSVDTRTQRCTEGCFLACIPVSTPFCSAVALCACEGEHMFMCVCVDVCACQKGARVCPCASQRRCLCISPSSRRQQHQPDHLDQSAA